LAKNTKDKQVSRTFAHVERKEKQKETSRWWANKARTNAKSNKNNNNNKAAPTIKCSLP